MVVLVVVMLHKQPKQVEMPQEPGLGVAAVEGLEMAGLVRVATSHLPTGVKTNGYYRGI
jgi:hypothetical protein